MTNSELLVGSLSNDLFRVASMVQRDSIVAAKRFLIEAKYWSKQLQQKDIAPYIKSIAENISQRKETDLSIDSAEDYLMYGILLQNYSLKLLN